MTRIGIDYTPAYEQTAGIGRYVRELIGALAAQDTASDYRLFVAGIKTPSELPPLPGENFTWASTRIAPKWLARLWHRARVPYPVERWLGGVELFHATDFVLPPVRRGTRTLLTVHDLSYVHVPEAASSRLRAYLNRVVPRSARRADHILADSQATKDDLTALYGIPPEKTTVLLSGVDPRFSPVRDEPRRAEVRAKYGLDSWPFLFTVGTVQPRKNYTRLFEALTLLRGSFPELRLVIAGGKGWLEGPIYQAVDRLNLRDRVHFIGFADDEDLPVLYSMAAAVPYVSLYEGFGLPILEAMACGAPVVSSNISSMPEVAGDAALLVAPADVTAIAAALQKVLTDSALRETLIAKGFRQAARFTWMRAARQLHTVYKQVLTAPPLYNGG